VSSDTNANKKDLPSYRVSKLRHGTVIDHLDAGAGLQALALLRIPKNTVCAVGMNFESGKHGRKDIIKIEGMELSPQEINKIVLFGPHATLSIIRDYELVEKINVEVPDRIVGVVTCPNPSCITNHEPVTTRFDVMSAEPMRVRCHYCERAMSRDELVV